MAIQSGNLMLLKVRVADKFITIGGLKTTRMILNNQIIDITNKLSNNWRELMSSGIRSITISASGIFTDSESERKIRDLSFSGKKDYFQLCFGSGEIMEGEFLISSFERSGNYGDEETYAISLESAGFIENRSRNLGGEYEV